MEVQSINSNGKNLNLQKVSLMRNNPPAISTPVEVIAAPKKDVVEIKSVAEPSGWKKGLVGLSSLIIPGLGQGINGQLGKAGGFFGGAVALGIPIYLFGLKLKSEGHVNKPLFFTNLIALWGLKIFAAYDAYKNTKA